MGGVGLAGVGGEIGLGERLVATEKPELVADLAWEELGSLARLVAVAKFARVVQEVERLGLG